MEKQIRKRLLLSPRMVLALLAKEYHSYLKQQQQKPSAFLNHWQNY